jgi:hypothetical protein
MRNDICDHAPIGLPDANSGEVLKAIVAIMKQAKSIPGRALGYDQLKDIYYVIGKSMTTGKAQDFTIQGDEVATVIKLARMMAGGRLDFVAG